MSLVRSTKPTQVALDCHKGAFYFACHIGLFRSPRAILADGIVLRTDKDRGVSSREMRDVLKTVRRTMVAVILCSQQLAR